MTVCHMTPPALKGLAMFGTLIGMSDPRLADYLRVGEAAELLGLSPGTIRNWARRGYSRSSLACRRGRC